MNELINLGNGQFVKVTMLKGEKGSNIATITKTGTSGLVDTYTVTLTDGSTTTFEVKNGKTIVSVVKTGTSGLVDTYTITYNDNTTSTFTVTNGRGIERIDKTWTSGLVDTYTITYNDGTTSTFDVTNGNAESLQDAIKASSCAIKAGVSQVEFTQLGSAYITYIPNSECVENAIVVVCFDNGSMYKGTLNYSSTIGRWGISDVSLIQGSDVPATWNVGYGNDSVGTRAFRTGTDFVYSSGVGIALSTSSSVVSYYCVLSSGRVSNNYLQSLINKLENDKVNTSDVANNLTTTDSGKVLDARQGKILNDALTYRYDFISSSNTLADMVSQMISKKLKMMPFSVWTSSSEFPHPFGSGICIRGYDGASYTIFYNVTDANYYRAYSGMYLSTNNTITWRRIDVGSCKKSTDVTIPTTATATSYTAPTDGYLEICTHTTSGVNNLGYVQRGYAYYTISREGAANSTKLTTIVPLTKGETVTLYAQASVAIDSCKFWG